MPATAADAGPSTASGGREPPDPWTRSMTGSKDQGAHAPRSPFLCLLRPPRPGGILGGLAPDPPGCPMRTFPSRRLLTAFGGLVLFAALARSGAEPAATGPQTEKRFPPLRVPDGFKATLFACDPLIEYPSVIAAGPRQGTLFVAVDFMTGLGTEIVRRDEIHLVEDTDGDGYADRATVVADGFK